MTAEWVRCFIAVELPSQLLTRVEGVQRALRGVGGEPVKWVSSGQIHITLKFLGNVEASRLETIEDALARAVRDRPPFALTMGGLGAFPNPRRPRVVWVGIEGGQEDLRALQRAVDQALAALGFPPEQRPFSPHLTLGRVRETAAPDQVQKLAQRLSSTAAGALGSSTVDSITFMRSTLTPGGPIYTRLAVVALGAGG